MTIEASRHFTKTENGSRSLDEFFALPNCGIIMSTDGTFAAFSSISNPGELAGDIDDLDEDQQAALKMGEKLAALTLALSNDQVMAVLLDIVRNTGTSDLESPKHVHIQ